MEEKLNKDEFSERYTKEERRKSNPEDDFKKIQNLLKEEPKRYSRPYILRMLNEKDSLRKVFLAIVKNDPAKVGEIAENTLIQKTNLYLILPNLVTLGLVERIWVADILNGKIENSTIKNKFFEWTSKMEEKTRRYYVSKTSYWKISEFGKKFVFDAYKFEQKFREGENE